MMVDKPLLLLNRLKHQKPKLIEKTELLLFRFMPSYIGNAWCSMVNRKRTDKRERKIQVMDIHGYPSPGMDSLPRTKATFMGGKIDDELFHFLDIGSQLVHTRRIPFNIF